MSEMLLIGVVEYFGDWDLYKARTHKYFKRVPYTDKKGKRRFKYFYKIPSGRVVAKDSIVVGASFAYGEGDAKGHYHITKVKDGAVTIRHDETGETRTVSIQALQDLLQPKSSAEDTRSRATKIRDLLLQAAKTGSDKQFNRLVSIAEKFHKDHDDGVSQAMIQDGLRESKRLRQEESDRKKREKERKATVDASFGGKIGAKTHVFYAGADGKPVVLEGEYRLVEADTMIPSHDPTSFKRNDKYPEGLQERAYHSDPAEKSKVRNNAQNMHPALVANTNPDALNGPPILNEDGVVLGGNSRAMSLQLVHQQGKEKAQELKDYLKDYAYQMGLKAEDVEAMKNPVLVRVIKTKGQDQNLLVRAMNEGFTQGMDPRTMMVAMSRRLDDKALNTLANAMNADQTLSEFLDSRESRDFVSELSRVGIIDARNKNQYVNKRTGRLNEDGKTLIERVLVGKLIPDADLLSNTRSSTLGAIARAVPYLVQAESAGKSYSLRENLKDALSAFNKMHDMGYAPSAKDKDLDFALNQVKRSLDDMFEGEHPINKNKKSEALFELLVKKGGPKQLAAVFKEYAKQAKLNLESQSSMFGGGDPSDVFDRTIQAAIDGRREQTQTGHDQGSLFRSLRQCGFTVRLRS